MIQSLLSPVINEKDFEFAVQSFNVTEGVNIYNYFPTREVNGLMWKSASNAEEQKRAARIIARNASLPLGENPTIETLRGDIPKIGVKYFMLDDELTEFQTALRKATDTAAAQLVRETFDNHATRVINMINNRVTWMALQGMSRGKIELTKDNNGSVVAEGDVDYQMQKRGRFGEAWTNAATAHPISIDFVKAIQDGETKGRRYRFAWMSLNTFAQFAATEEVIKLSASFATNLLGAAYIPSLEQVNTALRGRADLKGLQINIIDELIDVDGEGKNPFIDGVVLFTESETLGTSFWCEPADMMANSAAAMRSLNSFICIKEWAQEDPLMEITAGVANIIPAFTASQRALLLDTKNETWNEGI